MSVLIGKELPEIRESGSGKSNIEKLNILILEDSEADMELMLVELKKGGLKFIAKRVDTFNGFTLELERFNPSIILADYSLPNFTGIDALRHLKKNSIDVPFIIVTGSQSDEVAVQCIKEGADDYILKSNLRALSGAVITIIKKKRSEQAKARAEKQFIQYQKLCENLLYTQSKLETGFIIINGTRKQVMYVNETFCTMCGYNASEIFNLPSILELMNEKCIQMFQTQLQKINKNKNSTATFVAAINKKDGKIVNLEFTVRQLLKDSKSSIEGPSSKEDQQIILIVRDVTGKVRKELMQRLTQEALRENERRFRSLIENVKDYAIFMLDLSGRIISWNAGAARIMGYSDDEIILKEFAIFSSDTSENGNSAEHLLEKARKDGRIEKELWIAKKGNQKFWASTTITTLFNEKSEPKSFSVIIRDLTKSKIADEQLREHEMQLRLLAAHLQAVREEERTRIARELHDEFGQLLTALRMDLTILSRMISKSVSEPLNRISLLEKISSISELLETTIKSTRRIITELRPAVLDELGLLTAIQWQAQEFENRTGIRCRIVRLQHDIVLDQNASTATFRIFQEALTNVARHASATTVIVSLQAVGDEIVLEINDNGKGMEEGRTKDPTSAGILGIRERVLALGGKFEIFSEKEKGTKLIILIPYDKN